MNERLRFDSNSFKRLMAIAIRIILNLHMKRVTWILRQLKGIEFDCQIKKLKLLMQKIAS